MIPKLIEMLEEKVRTLKRESKIYFGSDGTPRSLRRNRDRQKYQVELAVEVEGWIKELKQAETTAVDAARYRFIRIEDNWGPDNGNDWSDLGELTMDEFDDYIDLKIVCSDFDG